MNLDVNLFKTVEKVTAGILDRLANAVAGPASTLRDGTEHHVVQFPKDLYAHDSVQTEWWYYTGHLQTVGGTSFGFELVFFKRRTDLDRFGVVPLRLLANPLYLAHFAITDERRGSFRYAHRKSARGLFDLPARMATDRYFLKLGNWTVREVDGAHLLRATLGADLIFEARLTSTKSPVLNGRESSGVSFKDEGEASRYFSFTRMKAEGAITWHGKTERFVGSAWMDREFGTWHSKENIKGWDWFSLQLTNGTDVIVYHIRGANGDPTQFSNGTYVDPDGTGTHLVKDNFTITVLDQWTSPKTGCTYPIKWRIQIPRFGLDLLVTPVIKDQELDTRGTTMIVYWEGACTVRGRHGNESVEGRAYAELVGYDRSHDSPSIGTFILGDSLDSRWRSIFG
jgi:predicted secreted hydrolase